MPLNPTNLQFPIQSNYPKIESSSIRPPTQYNVDTHMRILNAAAAHIQFPLSVNMQHQQTHAAHRLSPIH